MTDFVQLYWKRNRGWPWPEDKAPLVVGGTALIFVEDRASVLTDGHPAWSCPSRKPAGSAEANALVEHPSTAVTDAIADGAWHTHQP